MRTRFRHGRGIGGLSSFGCIVLLALASSACGTSEPAIRESGRVAPSSAPATDKVPPTAAQHANPDARVIQYQPGIRIDFRIPQVEVAGEVVHRDVELELFAYAKAPTPKEHETILLLRSRPLHMHEALGLIGLTPGHPVSYNWETQEITPATGDAVDVFVRYEKNGVAIERSACDWMFDAKANAPMKQTHWLFTGSKTDEKGRYAADIEGTVVTVVNFDTSVLSLPDSHSDSNADLWLTANTAEIPEEGTRLTLILRPAAAPTSTKE